MTAEEFLLQSWKKGTKFHEHEKVMIEFAKYHVKQALENASEVLPEGYGLAKGEFHTYKDKILNSYPENLIK